MTSIPQLAESLQQILEKEARQLAKETGFIERERGFNGADFAQALILGWLQQPDERRLLPDCLVVKSNHSCLERLCF